MTWTTDVDEHRRRLLVRALAAGLFAAGAPGLVPRSAQAQLFGQVPEPLPPGKSVYQLEGDVRANGRPVTRDTVIKPSDTIESGPDGKLIFVVGKDAFVLRENSQLRLSGDNVVVSGLRLLTGALLSVFGKTRHWINTPVATIGIRGTGIYVESEAARTYACTCYGVTDLASAEDTQSTEQITSRHHDAPRYITADRAAGQNIEPAPFKNHTDLELEVIEALVGRSPPFMFSGDAYGGPRRRY